MSTNYNFKIIRRGKKFGVIRDDGRELLPFIYDKIVTDYVYNFFEAVKDGKIGFVAFSGKELLPLTNKVENVSINRQARMFEVKQGGGIAFYNFNGKELLSAKYSSDIITAYQNGFVIRHRGSYRYMNFAGEDVLSGFDGIEEIPDFTQNVLRACKDGKYGVFNLKGEELMPIKYDYVFVEHGVCRGVDTLNL